jgi:hypothetical protein
MSLINDYTAQILSDQQERDLAELAFRDPHARRALNRQGTWWNRVLSRRDRTPVATERGEQTSTTPPRHRPTH